MPTDTITLQLNVELSNQAKALLKTLSCLAHEGEPMHTYTGEDALTPPSPGQYWSGQGGHFICTLPALQNLPARHLIVGSDEAEDLKYGPRENVPGATSHINGRANSTALICTHRDHQAAKWAGYYNADGHSDFFLPARLDMLMAYICTPQLFKKDSYYWTSTQNSPNDAFFQDFEYGYSIASGKGNEYRARAFRVIPLPL